MTVSVHQLELKLVQSQLLAHILHNTHNFYAPGEKNDPHRILNKQNHESIISPPQCITFT